MEHFFEEKEKVTQNSGVFPIRRNPFRRNPIRRN